MVAEEWLSSDLMHILPCASSRGPAMEVGLRRGKGRTWERLLRFLAEFNKIRSSVSIRHIIRVRYSSMYSGIRTFQFGNANPTKTTMYPCALHSLRRLGCEQSCAKLLCWDSSDLQDCDSLSMLFLRFFDLSATIYNSRPLRGVSSVKATVPGAEPVSLWNILGLKDLPLEYELVARKKLSCHQ